MGISGPNNTIGRSGTMETVSFFLVFLAILVIGAAAFVGSRFLGSGSGRWASLEDPAPNLPPVLLPEDPAPSDVDRVRFSPGLRGYRMDQVDQVLDRLRDQLALKDEEIRRLRKAASSEQVPGGEHE
jgi:DivIVA domain-containing protein